MDRAGMKIAVVGSGIAGLGAMHLLARAHDVTLFEASDRIGGHTHTHRVERWGKTYHVDSGFIVFNEGHYPLFSALLRELDVESQATKMSFAVTNARTGLEYAATNLDTLFCQRRNAVSPRFLGMMRDLVRFYREARAASADMRPLGTFLRDEGYGEAFRDDHLVPMASALWSCPAGKALDIPTGFLVRFMANHEMLALTGRAPWRVVRGGSASYVRAILARTKATVRTNAPVTRVVRTETGVRVTAAGEEQTFDRVVLACHADDALALLGDASEEERALLSAIPFEDNDVVLHHDASLLPRSPKAISAWNAHVPFDSSEACTVSYSMNVLQGLDSPEPFVVTLNRTRAIHPDKVIARMAYRHPVFTRQSVVAAEALAKRAGANHTFFAGAYMGFGFHEDGLRSAVRVAAALGVRFP